MYYILKKDELTKQETLIYTIHEEKDVVKTLKFEDLSQVRIIEGDEYEVVTHLKLKGV